MKDLIQAVIEAGAKIRDNFDGRKDVHFKGKTDLVTEFDVAIEKELTEKIRTLFPDHEIIGEESGISGKTPRPGKTIHLDPIDGTTNFVHGFPFTCVSVGGFNGDEAEFGIVYNPIMDELFTARKGEGAFLNGERITVSPTPKAIESLVATGFPAAQMDTDQCDMIFPVLRRVMKATRGLRRPGSAALDLCYVAKGVFDAFYETGLNSWDVAGGICIVEEAGGRITDGSGNPYRFGTPFIVATNGLIHDEITELIGF